MAEKIGFLSFNMLDAPSPSEFAAYKKLERRMEPNGHVKTLEQSHPPVPPWNTEAPAINRSLQARVYKLAAELSPWMDEFHSRVLDKARIQERLKMIERNRFQNDRAELKYFRQVDLLHAWISELLFERVYRRIGRDLETFEKVAKREWHEIKVLEQLNDHFKTERTMVEGTIDHVHELRHRLHAFLFNEVKMRLQKEFITRCDQRGERTLWNVHDVMRAFDKAWMHVWDSQDTFAELVRRGVFEKAELYPRLFRKAIRDPYEIEIREPNQKDKHQKIQEHIDLERQKMSLLNLEEASGRQLLRNNKKDLSAYRQVSRESAEDVRGKGPWQEHVQVETQDPSRELKQAESQDYSKLASRMMSTPKLNEDIQGLNRTPSAMGLRPDPRVPEHTSPTPLQLVPQQQQDLWQKTRSVHEGEARNQVEDRHQNWHEKAQVLRQNLAAIEYGEQKTKEALRPELKNPGELPVKDRKVEPTPRLEAIAAITPKALSVESNTAEIQSAKVKEK